MIVENLGTVPNWYGLQAMFISFETSWELVGTSKHTCPHSGIVCFEESYAGIYSASDG